MIGLLQGIPLSVSPERVLLDVHGVGYEVVIPVSTFYEIERQGTGATVRLFIHTHLRDDALSLFGFWTESEKQLFEKLIGVSGIGPRLARNILSGLPATELLTALAQGDVARLCRTPGVGKKTAERIVLELRDKVQELAAELPAATAGPASQDLVSALVNLGYRPADAQRAVTEVRQDAPEAAFHELLRRSLKLLSRA